MAKASNFAAHKTISLKPYIITPLALIWDRIAQTRTIDFIAFNFSISLAIHKEIPLLEFV